MNKRSKIGLFFIIVFTLLSVMVSCEKDDICANESVTPYLVISFVDDDDREVSNTVFDLQITYLGDKEVEDPDVFSSETTTDSVTLLLPTDENSARFAFKQNFDSSNPEDLTEVEIDIVEFEYELNKEYVSRACGFRTTHTNLKVTVTPGDGGEVTQGFIKSVLIDNQTIDDEEEAHVRFSHD